MFTFLTIIHMFVAVFLILFVLLQDSKGGAMGSLGGGASGSNSVFGSTGASSFLVKATRVVAILFAATCIILTVKTVSLAGKSGPSVIDDAPLNQQEAAAVGPKETGEAAPAAAAPTEPEAKTAEDTPAAK